jgi:integrase
VEGLLCGDLDEPNSRWRIRRAIEKGRHGRWVSVPPDLCAAVVATLPPRDDRSPDRPVFPRLTQGRLRTAIARACRASGTPAWSPHDLPHRRISLWHRQRETWALIGARVGQRSPSVTADTYTHVLLDDRELNHSALLAPRQAGGTASTGLRRAGNGIILAIHALLKTCSSVRAGVWHPKMQMGIRPS